MRKEWCTSRGARCAGLVVGAVIAGTAVSAHAQPAPHDPVTAEALFVEGKRLMQGRDYGSACPKLAESQRLDPSGGTVFALALCYEGAGKVATAWATFDEALAEARRDQRADREAGALEHVHALEQRLTRVRIDVPHPAAGLEVLRNGVPVGPVVWGTPVPVDPGKYTFEAHAPGKVPWVWTTTIDRPGEVFAVSVPDLSNVDAVIATMGAPPTASARPAGKRSYLLPEIGLGLVVVTGAIGAGLGVKASSDWTAAQANKTASRVGQASSAGTEADVATAMFVTCGAAAVAAGVLFAVIATSDGDVREDRRSSAFRVVPIVAPGEVGLSFGGAL